MASRLTASRRGRWLPGATVAVISLAAVLVVTGCTSAERPSIQGEDIDLPAPVQSFDADLSATAGQLRAAVADLGLRLDAPQQPYRPSEPQALLHVPRAVLRASLADPADGHVVIYRAADSAAATQLAGELAAYLESGFGQTNYPADAQFSISTVGSTIVFTWWSRSRSGDPERAKAVFDAVASVGDEVEVRK